MLEEYFLGYVIFLAGMMNTFLISYHIISDENLIWGMVVSLALYPLIVIDQRRLGFWMEETKTVHYNVVVISFCGMYPLVVEDRLEYAFLYFLLLFIVSLSEIIYLWNRN